MSKTIYRPDSHEDCVTQALELIQQSDAFLIVTVAGDDMRLGASVSTSLQDEMIGAGMMEFLHYRELERERQEVAANQAIH